jgi:hypothetical protein
MCKTPVLFSRVKLLEEDKMANAPVKDDLLAQLNGDLPPLAPGETAPIPAPSRESELTVAGPSPLSPAQRADASHSTKAGGKGWKVVVSGEYFAESPTGRGKIAKPYEHSFNLPNLDAALSVIKNKLLDSALRKKHSDFIAVRTNKISEAVPLSPETPLSNNLAYMNRAQLEAHIAHVRAPIVSATYAVLADLRDAIIDYTQTPDGFEKREKERQSKRHVDAELAELNPEIEVEA